MARFNPAFSGLLFIRRIGVAAGAWVFVDYTVCWFSQSPTSAPGFAAGMPWGAAIFAFFAPMIHRGPPDRDQD